MSWISLEERLPELNVQISLCKEGDPFQWVDEGSLIKNSFVDECCFDEFMFDGPGWYIPLPISAFTHWQPKTIPIHIDLTTSSSGE